jgi:hypothetical protein
MRRKPARRKGLLGTEVPGVIKRITVEELLALGSRAQQRGFHAVGRPTWTVEQRDKIEGVVLMPIVLRADGNNERLRCYAGTVVEKQGLVVFTIDVAMEDFKDLVDLTDVWDLAELLLYFAPHLPVDSEYLE